MTADENGPTTADEGRDECVETISLSRRRRLGHLGRCRRRFLRRRRRGCRGGRCTIVEFNEDDGDNAKHNKRGPWLHDTVNCCLCL